MFRAVVMPFVLICTIYSVVPKNAETIFQDSMSVMSLFGLTYFPTLNDALLYETLTERLNRFQLQNCILNDSKIIRVKLDIYIRYLVGIVE